MDNLILNLSVIGKIGPTNLMSSAPIPIIAMESYFNHLRGKLNLRPMKNGATKPIYLVQLPHLLHFRRLADPGRADLLKKGRGYEVRCLGE